MARQTKPKSQQTQKQVTKELLSNDWLHFDYEDDAYDMSIDVLLEDKNYNLGLVSFATKYIYHFKCNKKEWDYVPISQMEVGYYRIMQCLLTEPDVIDDKDEYRDEIMNWLYSNYRVHKDGIDWEFKGDEKKKAKNLKNKNNRDIINIGETKQIEMAEPETGLTPTKTFEEYAELLQIEL